MSSLIRRQQFLNNAKGIARPLAIWSRHCLERWLRISRCARAFRYSNQLDSDGGALWVRYKGEFRNITKQYRRRVKEDWLHTVLHRNSPQKGRACLARIIHEEVIREQEPGIWLVGMWVGGERWG